MPSANSLLIYEDEIRTADTYTSDDEYMDVYGRHERSLMRDSLANRSVRRVREAIHGAQLSSRLQDAKAAWMTRKPSLPSLPAMNSLRGMLPRRSESMGMPDAMDRADEFPSGGRTRAKSTPGAPPSQLHPFRFPSFVDSSSSSARPRAQTFGVSRDSQVDNQSCLD